MPAHVRRGDPPSSTVGFAVGGLAALAYYLRLRPAFVRLHQSATLNYPAYRQLGGPNGHYRIMIIAFTGYLQRCGSDRDAASRIRERPQRLLGRKAAAGELTQRAYLPTAAVGCRAAWKGTVMEKRPIPP